MLSWSSSLLFAILSQIIKEAHSHEIVPARKALVEKVFNKKQRVSEGWGELHLGRSRSDLRCLLAVSRRLFTSQLWHALKLVSISILVVLLSTALHLSYPHVEHLSLP